MNILKIKELIKAIRTQEPNSINNVKNTYGELVISCWEQLNPKELNNGSSVGGFASLFVYIESLKVSCIQRLPHGHSKKHAEKLIERLISHLKPENFANQALEYISPRIQILADLEEDLDYLEVLNTETYVRLEKISSAISELSSLRTSILNSQNIEENQKQVISACIELCERAAKNIDSYGMERFREEISCSYGRISLEIKSVDRTIRERFEEITSVAEKILAIIELVEIGGKALGLLNYTPTTTKYLEYQPQ